ncbi:hypothetical protein [Kordia jejudonensis]|uniref:hypothetical protein n=1 Tax=Kordia jejudonensis TaxID=1348245 RepID=UPI00062964CA|nr:hypothetical protein [Kordia jejudonensis]
MKKKNLKNLALNRKTISNLDASNSKGGNAAATFQCILTLVNANGVNICLESRECYITEKGCASILNPCITQTEFPTCRDCK